MQASANPKPFLCKTLTFSFWNTIAGKYSYRRVSLNDFVAKSPVT